MSRRLRVLLPCLCALAAFQAAAVRAQDQPSQPPVPDEIAAITRAQIIIMGLIGRAFTEDADLRARLDAFEEAQERAMVARNPQTAQRLARMAELEALHDQAVSTSGAPDANALLAEGRTLRDALRATAAEVRTDPSVAGAADALLAALRPHFGDLNDVDPDLGALVARDDLLLELLSVARLVSR